MMVSQSLLKNLKLMYVLIHREILESRKVLMYSLLIFAIPTLIGVISFIYTFVDCKALDCALSPMRKLAGSSSDDIAVLIFKTTLGFYEYQWFSVYATLMIGIYATSCIRKERENGVLFFWRSLPPSDYHALLSKVITALLVIPVVLWFGMAVMWGVLVSVSSVVVGIMYSFELQALPYGSIYRYVQKTMPWSWTGTDYFSMMPVRALWFLPLVCFLMLMQAVHKLGSLFSIVLVALSFLLLRQPPESIARFPGELVFYSFRYGMQMPDLRKYRNINYVFEEKLNNILPWSGEKSDSFDRFPGLTQENQKYWEVWVIKNKRWVDSPVIEYISRIFTPNSTFFVGLGLSAVFFWLTLWLRKRHTR